MTNYTISLQSIPGRDRKITISVADQIARLERRADAIADRWPAEAAEARAQAVKMREAR